MELNLHYHYPPYYVPPESDFKLHRDLPLPVPTSTLRQSLPIPPSTLPSKLARKRARSPSCERYTKRRRVDLPTRYPSNDPPCHRNERNYHHWNLRFLGAGGFGEVYITELPTQRRRAVAMKVIDLVRHHSESFWMIKSEVEALKRIRWNSHPFIIDQPCELAESNLVWWCREEASVYMLMNLYSMDLHTILQYWYTQGPNSSLLDQFKYTKNVAYEMVQGLNHLHWLGIIHRDIKPANIFIDAWGHCKIADFGGAVILSDERNAPMPAHSRIVRSTYLGSITDPFFAPELLLPGIYDRRSQQHYMVFDETVDYWSLGVMIYDLATSDSVNWHAAGPNKELKDFIAFRERMQSVLRDIKWTLYYQGCDDSLFHLRDLSDFILGCCTISPHHRISDEEAALRVARWQWHDMDVPSLEELNVLLKDPGSKVYCSAEFPVSKAMPGSKDPQTYRERASSAFANMLSRMPPGAISIPRRSIHDNRLFVTSTCAKHPSGNCAWRNSRHVQEGHAEYEFGY